MKKEQILILELLNDPDYRIEEDGSVFTCIDRGGHRGNLWRQVPKKKIICYKHSELSYSRVVFYKFNKAVDESWIIKHKDKNQLNNHINNLHCPRLAEEIESSTGLKKCTACLQIKKQSEFNKKIQSTRKTLFLNKICKTCQKLNYQKFYNKNKDLLLKKKKDRTQSKPRKEKNKVRKWVDPRSPPKADVNVGLIDRYKKFTCKLCSIEFLDGRCKPLKFCSDRCYILSTYSKDKFNNLSLIIIKKTKGLPDNLIGMNAKAILVMNNIEKECKECKSTFHSEACHIKPIISFNDNALLSEINSLDNLAYLCPNHHAVLDRPRNRLKEVAESRKDRGTRLHSPIDNETIGSRTREGKKSNKYQSIRNHARTKIINSTLPIKCHICNFDQATEICHLKPIADFPPDALISEVNHLSNLILLCPNHHWKLDNSRLDPDEKAKIDAYIQSFEFTPIP
jgi:ribosomal protein L19E